MKKVWKGYVLIAPLMLGCLIFFAIPFVMVLRYSFLLQGGLVEEFVGLENYMVVSNNHIFSLAFGNTMKFLAAGLPLIMVLAYILALLMQKQAQKHKLLKSVFLMPYIMPVAGTVMLIDILFSETGVWNNLNTLLGLPIADWLGGPLAFWVVVMLYLWKNTGYSVILLLAGLVTIPEDQYESADLDGASAWQKFLHITTPQMWYSVFFAVVFSVINAFKCFREIFLVGGQWPNLEIYMLQHFLNNSFETLNYANLSVASVLLFIVVTTAFSAFYAFVKRKEV